MGSQRGRLVLGGRRPATGDGWRDDRLSTPGRREQLLRSGADRVLRARNRCCIAADRSSRPVRRWCGRRRRSGRRGDDTRCERCSHGGRGLLPAIDHRRCDGGSREFGDNRASGPGHHCGGDHDDHRGGYHDDPSNDHDHRGDHHHGGDDDGRPRAGSDAEHRRPDNCRTRSAWRLHADDHQRRHRTHLRPDDLLLGVHPRNRQQPAHRGGPGDRPTGPSSVPAAET